MDLRRGDVYYNEVIPTDEIWEDTLKRSNLQIMQLDLAKGASTYNIFHVLIFVTDGEKLVLFNASDMDKKEIENYIKGFFVYEKIL